MENKINIELNIEKEELRMLREFIEELDWEEWTAPIVIKDEKTIYFTYSDCYHVFDAEMMQRLVKKLDGIIGFVHGYGETSEITDTKLGWRDIEKMYFDEDYTFYYVDLNLFYNLAN